ncbi:MAG: hypothetical protein AAGF56_06985 [Pseudomonadota bacterium]
MSAIDQVFGQPQLGPHSQSVQVHSSPQQHCAVGTSFCVQPQAGPHRSHAHSSISVILRILLSWFVGKSFDVFRHYLLNVMLESRLNLFDNIVWGD